MSAPPLLPRAATLAADRPVAADRDRPSTPSEQLLFARAELRHAQQQREAARRAARAAAHARLVGADPPAPSPWPAPRGTTPPSTSSASAPAFPPAGRGHRRHNSYDAARSFFSSTSTSSIVTSNLTTSSSSGPAPFSTAHGPASARTRVLSDLPPPPSPRAAPPPPDHLQDKFNRRASAPIGKSHGHGHRRSRTASSAAFLANVASAGPTSDAHAPPHRFSTPLAAPPAGSSPWPAGSGAHGHGLHGTPRSTPHARSRTTSLPALSANRDPYLRTTEAPSGRTSASPLGARGPVHGDEHPLLPLLGGLMPSSSSSAAGGAAKPVLHFWLAASVSSVALVALGVLMSLSYLLTAYDDAARQSHRVSSTLTRAHLAVRSVVPLPWAPRGWARPGPHAADGTDGTTDGATTTDDATTQ